MAYSTITNSEIAVGAPITNALMIKVRDNPEAIAQGLSGATRIVYGALNLSNDIVAGDIAAGAVGRSELKSTTASQSTSISAGATGEINPTGGSYTMGWFAGDSHGGNPYWLAVVAHSSTYSATVAANNTDGSSHTLFIYSRYVQSSPPYNLGYGEIPKFILAQIDKSTGDVIGTYSAEDPPWAYHGPHDCHPINSILLRSVGLWGVNISEAMKIDPDATLEKLKAMRELRQDKKRFQQVKKDYALSVEDKNIDMDAVPHLFSNFDPSKHAAVMLDPCCSLTEKLALEDEFTGPEFSVSSLLHDGYLQIDNESLPVNRTPSGVITVGYRFKKGR